MEKKKVKEPIFENIQTGFNEKEVFVTNDGKEFDYESEAKHHEFYNLKVHTRGLEGFPISEVTIMDLTCIEDLEKYITDYCYNTTKFTFDKENLTYPNTYVFYTDFVTGEDFGIDDVWYDYDNITNCLTLEEWKVKMTEAINNLK